MSKARFLTGSLALVVLAGLSVPSSAGEGGALGLRLFRAVHGDAARAWANAGLPRVVPFDHASGFKLYSPALILRDLESSSPEEDGERLTEALDLKEVSLVHEAVLSFERDSDGRICGSVETVMLEGRVFGVGVLPADPGSPAGVARIRIYEEPDRSAGTAGALGAVVASNYLVDVEVAVSKATPTVIGFLDSRNAPWFLVVRPA